jgi:two-component system sensor histidine kinase HupT/HoxJ
VVVTIRDYGPGIAADVMPKIFDPFFTTKDVGQGTGLGLAITYGIVSEHGGVITASNAPDGGAVFEIELPAVAVGGKVSTGSGLS